MNHAEPSRQVGAAPKIISAPQSASHAPKGFQSRLIDGLCAALAETPRPPCLLRSPTGSGKTFMLTRILQRMSERSDVLWLWFVPYVNLVAQTVDTLDSQASETGLLAKQLGMAQHEEPEAGLVLVSTVQAVASAKSRRAGFDDKGDDERRSLAAFLGLARARGLEIGLVVDEAHIALDNGTEFGQFVKWLRADYLLMASATPKDARLNEFIAGAGNIGFKSFSVSRADVVAERLNKPWLETVVYPLSETMQGVTDLKLTVLRRAWRRNQQIAQLLKARGLSTVPLMLVQVANGDEAIRQAFEFLTQQLGVPPNAVAMHSADEPDPTMMAAVAVNTSIEVLIFKQSAGTGFDAPRAFVLASTKPVNDEDFAMQFIGRVMRVPRELQQAFPEPFSAPAELDTAYIFLANAQAQTGFAEAARATKAVISQLDGQIEALHAFRTAHGGHGLSNRPTTQPPLAYDMAALPVLTTDGQAVPQGYRAENSPAHARPAFDGFEGVERGDNLSLFGAGAFDSSEELDRPLPSAAAGPASTRRAPATPAELLQALESEGLRAYPRKPSVGLRATPRQFRTEVKPAFDVLELDIVTVAQTLELPDALIATATKAALNRLTELEIRTELFGGHSAEESVQVVTDRAALMARTAHALSTLGLEEQDHTDLITTLARRLVPSIERAYEPDTPDTPPGAGLMQAHARDAACWVIHKQLPEIQQALTEQWAGRAREELAAPLPDALLMPGAKALEASRKNIYGVLFPEPNSVAQAASLLPVSALPWFKNASYVLAEGEHGTMNLARLDATYEFNTQELAFARALDRADFVAWWHRNPQGKPFSIGLMRSDSRNLFYPDFVVCLHHEVGDEPLVRLVETKHDVKDASRKAQHHANSYGRVLFLTKDASRFKIVEADGSLGDVVDFDDLARLREWMRDSMPNIGK